MQKKCQQCSGDFTPYVGRQRFCCRECSDAWFQSERREAVEQFRQRERAPTSYFAREAANQATDGATGGASLVGATAFGPTLPAPAWAADPTGKERPLGQDVNALPDMRTCWWIEGAVPPGETPDEA